MQTTKSTFSNSHFILGPLVYSGGSGTILYGVISWGAKCGDPKFPGIYAKVSVYRDWINNVN